ncbi:MAG TPA: peptidase S41 [Cryomorphaceae bacterium]|nr:peptidase S41 [Owenweeksia sp.]HAD96291.1 peptidase S41 [Cryomorphaceae bacterium]HCQ17439.1 peptidase S41 [Cryomorphaceae bacterium]
MKYSMKKFLKYGLGVLTATVLVVSVAYTPDYFEISKQLDIFTNVFKEVNLYYVDETEPGELMDEAIVSMLSSLDPYTNYIPEEMVEDYKIQTTGNYGGIGAGIRTHDGKIVVTMPYEGFAADKAGLMAGDIILTVDGKSVEGKSTEDVSKILKGAPGTKFTMTISRDGEHITKEIEREEVQVKSVPYYGMLNSGIGYISLNSFTDKATTEVREAFTDLRKSNDLKGLILDLRGNPGGLLSEAVNITNLFVDKGREVVKTKGKMEEWEKTYRTLNKPMDTNIPLAVLINRGSASASEIVSGTLQDYDRAVIIGQRSFGKGLVQQTRKLSYGAQLKVTIAKYYTPSGRCIQAINYAERAEDGSVSKIPDSLRTRFETVNGRPVFDGGGIDPDITVDDEELSNAIIALYQKLLIFDYATVYKRNHPSIAPAANFELTDQEYQAFLSWLGQKDFDYQTKTEQKLEELKKFAEKENYLDGLEADINSLMAKYSREEDEDLKSYEKEIRILLEEEIVSRYYYERGRIQNAIEHDDDVKEALKVLNDSPKYTNILTVASN